MTRRRFAALMFALGSLLFARAASAQSAAQPPLPSRRLTIVSAGGVRHLFDVEVTRTTAEERTGLMFRTQIAAAAGMLFPLPAPQISKMWMKNTLVPLDMVFIDAKGIIVHIAENTVPQSLRIITAREPVLATLELQGGITAKLGITVGDKVLFPLFHTAP